MIRYALAALLLCGASHAALAQVPPQVTTLGNTDLIPVIPNGNPAAGNQRYIDGLNLANSLGNLIGAPCLTGTLTSGNAVIGAPTSKCIEDSGNQLIKTGVASRNPSATDDSTQGYSIGSLWINTDTSIIYAASSVTPSAAVWTAAISSVPYAPIITTFTNVASNTSNYTCMNLNNTSQNNECLISLNATFSNFYARISVAPGDGQTDVLTLYTGDPVPSVMTATNITCSITGTATTCNDLTHSATISAGQVWSIFVQVGAGAPATSVGTVSFTGTY